MRIDHKTRQSSIQVETLDGPRVSSDLGPLAIYLHVTV